MAISFRVLKATCGAGSLMNPGMAWTNSRLRLKIDGIDDADIIVARERVQEFKNWLDR